MVQTTLTAIKYGAVAAQVTPTGADGATGFAMPILLVLLSVFLVTIACFLLMIKIIFKKNGRFPSPHIHDNAALRRRGIHCAGHTGDSQQANK